VAVSFGSQSWASSGGAGPQGGDGGVGHADRAAVAGYDLLPDVEQGGPGDVGAGAGPAPASGVDAVLDGAAEEAVPGGVELDLVDAAAAP